MVSRNQKLPVPVPAAGVRRDFDPFSMPAQALEYGQNVIVRKGVLVPRACYEPFDWYSTSEWELLLSREDCTAIAYESGNTRFLFYDSHHNIIMVSDDEFVTISSHQIPDPNDHEIVKIIHDATNNLWIVLCDDGNIYTAPEAWPDSGGWTERLDAGVGTQLGMVHEPVSGVTVALIAPDGLKSYRSYYSLDGTTWAYSPPSETINAGAEIGVGAKADGVEYFFIRTEKDPTTDYLLGNDPAKLDSEWDNSNETGKDRTNFFGGGTTTCCIFDDGTDNLVEKTTDLGANFATELGSGLAYTGDRYTRLFYDADLNWLVLGRDNYRSDDAATWTQYSRSPFGADAIIDAISDGTDWFILSEAGVYRFPATVLADEESVVSMHQFDSDGAENQVIVSTTNHLRKLNATTGEFTDLPFDEAQVTPGDPHDWPAVEFDISGEPRSQRTVFRSFPWNGGSGETLYSYLLATNPDLPPVYWRSGENVVTWCDHDNTHGSKVMLISANRIVLGNGPQGSPYGVDCSADLDPTSGWNGLNSGLLADTPGAITAGAELTALQFAMFKEDSVYHGMAQTEFAGVANAFRYEMIRTGIQGPVAQHALQKTPDGALIYLGQDGGVYGYDGNVPRDLGGHVRRIVETQMDFDNRDNAWGYVDAIERLAYFFFPTVAGNMNRGVCVDLQSGAAWEIQLPSWFQAAAGGPMFISQDMAWADFDVAWSEMTAAWNSFQSGNYYVVMGAENNTWGKQNWGDIDSYTDFGESIKIVWKPGWSPLGDPDKYATLQEIRWRMGLLHDGEEFTCKAFSLDSQFEQDEEQDDDTFTSDTTEYTTEFDLSGQLFRYEMRAEITKRFVCGGGIARFKQRGDW